MAEEEVEAGKQAPIPGWAPQILKRALRDYRYAAFVAQGSDDEHLRIDVRRGAEWIGHVTIEHWIVEDDGRERHDIRIVFHGIDKDLEKRFTPHSLRQMEEFAPAVAGEICRYGMSRDSSWCDECSQEERHKEGRFEPPRGPQLEEQEGKRRYLGDDL